MSVTKLINKMLTKLGHVCDVHVSHGMTLKFSMSYNL